MAAAVTERNGAIAVTRVDPLFTLTFPYGAYHAFDVSADGSRFLVNRLVSQPEASMTIIVNWSPVR